MCVAAVTLPYRPLEHKNLIEYIKINYKQFNNYEILFINKLRILRNRISYDGFFVEYDYILRNLKNIENIISKLKKIIKIKF